MKQKNKKNQTGFTLMELLVAMSIFTVMILSITAIFARVNEGQRHAIAAQNIQESMRYAYEVIAKEIRMAKPDETGTCAGVGKLYLENADTLKFVNYHDECVTYYLDNNSMTVSRVKGGITQLANASPASIIISNLKFVVVDLNGVTQPKVTIKMDIEAIGKNVNKQKMTFQTTISSRNY